MGKGDRKTARGKIWRGSYGKPRPHHPGRPQSAQPAAIAPPKKKRR